MSSHRQVVLAALLVAGIAASWAQSPCYIPYFAPACLLDTQSTLEEAIVVQANRARQRSSSFTDAERMGTYTSRLEDALAVPRLRSALDSLYGVVVAQLAERYGADYLCAHLELEAPRYGPQFRIKTGAYTGSFAFHHYIEPKRCYNDPYRRVKVAYEIPADAEAYLVEPTIVLDTSSYHRDRSDRAYGYVPPVVEELAASGAFAQPGSYAVSVEDNGRVAGYSARVLPMEAEVVAFDSLYRGYRLDPARRVPFVDDALPRSRGLIREAVADATCIRVSRSIDSLGLVREVRTYRIHTGYGSVPLDSLLYVTRVSDASRALQAEQQTPVGKSAIYQFLREARYGDVQALQATGLYDTAMVYDQAIDTEADRYYYLDFLGYVGRQYRERDPGVHVVRYSSRPLVEAVRDSLRAAGVPLRDQNAPFLLLGDEQAVMVTRGRRELEALPTFTSTQPHHYLDRLVLPYRYDLDYLGDSLVARGGVRVTVPSITWDDGTLLSTTLATAYQLTLRDTGPGAFVLELALREAQQPTTLLTPQQERNLFGAAHQQLRLTLPLSATGELPDTLLELAVDSSLLEGSRYRDASLAVRPFAGVVPRALLTRRVQRSRNYFVNNLVDPSLDSLSTVQVAPGDTLTLYGEHLDKAKQYWFTGRLTYDGYTYYRYIPVPDELVLERSASAVRLVVPARGVGLYGDERQFALCSGLVRAGYRGYGPRVVRVDRE